MNEWNYQLYPKYELTSISNGINPPVNLLIDSIDKFSFGEDSLDCDKHEKKISQLKLKVIGPSNYYSNKIFNDSNNKNDLFNCFDDICNKELSQLDFSKIFDDMNKIIENKEKEKENLKNKICGVFTKEDFDIKINQKQKNQLNESFEKKYLNPLENDFEENNTNREISKNTINNDIFDKNENKNQNLNLKNNNENIPLIDSLQHGYKETKEEKIINLPLCLNEDGTIPSPLNSESSKKRGNNEEEKSIKKFDNKILTKYNINPIILIENKSNNNFNINNSNKNDINLDLQKKLIELTEKVEKSESNIKQIKTENEHLLKIIKNFRNMQNSNDPPQFPHSGKNTPTSFESIPSIPIKRICYSPATTRKSKSKINNSNSNYYYRRHSKTKSYSKKDLLNYDLTKKSNTNRNFLRNNIKKFSTSYFHLNGKENKNNNTICNTTKKIKKTNNKHNNNKYFNTSRNTLYITGNHITSNFKKLTKNNNFRIETNNTTNNSLSYNSSLGTNNQLLIVNDYGGNIFQRQIMRLPPEEQPLFYESNTNFNNCNRKIKGKNIIKKNSNQKNKLLDFKDFEIIFDENENVVNKNNGLIEKNNTDYRNNNVKKISEYLSNKNNQNKFNDNFCNQKIKTNKTNDKKNEIVRNQNNTDFMVPFYLINTQEMLLNMFNYSNKIKYNNTLNNFKFKK